MNDRRRGVRFGRGPAIPWSTIGIPMLLALAVASSALAATEVQIGPGVAGQIHALAYDPEDPDRETIYAGGDNFGVYRTIDHGESWHPWNEGMQHEWPMRTSYVDDILVVPADATNPLLRSGIYAATFGGMMFRDGELDTWQHETIDETYSGGIMLDHGGAIPFASLAFDAETNRLFAGAGRARKSSNDTSSIYPETGVGDEYSLWCKDLDASGGDDYYDWAPVTDIGNDGNVGTVRQIGIVTRAGTESRLVVAASEGIYIQSPQRNGWQCIWDPDGDPALSWPQWSQNAWGVAVGGQGRLYTVTSFREDGRLPSVWWIEPDASGSDYVYDSSDWYRLGTNDPTPVPPQDALPWSEVVGQHGVTPAGAPAGHEGCRPVLLQVLAPAVDGAGADVFFLGDQLDVESGLALGGFVAQVGAQSRERAHAPTVLL